MRRTKRNGGCLTGSGGRRVRASNRPLVNVKSDDALGLAMPRVLLVRDNAVIE